MLNRHTLRAWIWVVACSLLAAAQADRAYERGAKALDERQWEKAAAAFGEVERGSVRADGALYWKAYAHNKLGRREDALAAIAELQKSFPNSRWIQDARALEAEVRQGAGQAAAPETEADEELKLMAIHSLLNTDPERAVPLLEKVLAGSHPPKLKERALFVLSQSGSPRAREVLAGIARGKANPDLQLKAVQYLGLFGGKASRQVLADIYGAASELEVKRAILRSFMLAGERERLLAAAKQEQNAELRKEAIRQLGLMGAGAELAAIYQADSDKAVRKEALKALFLHGNAKALVEIARKESDPELKKEAVRQLSLMRAKEATDFLMELLNK